MFSPVANGAVHKLCGGHDTILFNQLGSKRGLVFRRGISHGVNLIERANEVSRVAVAVDAPGHVKRFRFYSRRHLVDPAVAGFATNPFVDMDVMVKVNMIRKLINLVPHNWLASIPTLTDRDQERAV
jgi:hypothetical protein